MIVRNAYRALAIPSLAKRRKLIRTNAPVSTLPNDRMLARKRGALLREIREFLKAHQMLAPSFGRLALKDAEFVFELRAGKQPSHETEAKARTFMAEYAP